MSVTLHPYINFRGTCQEAMEFYRSVLGGDLQVMSFADSGMPEMQGVMHSMLTTADGLVLLASDTPDEMPLTFGDNMSVSLVGDESEAEKMRGWFQGLAQGGEVTVPLAQQMWGAEFGMITDRFGVRWMVNIGG
ncbi:VOC family protein [Luteococcus peritonei]|uniref:VOC family protein n=1 Tax=Luteococcus peritonei TaxID=88874 RepID=A0ABW4RTQ9_9ACTN